MNLRILVASVVLLVAGAAAAQTTQAPPPMKLQPLELQVQPRPELESNLPEHKIAKLEAENRRLEEENVRLRKQHEDMTALGGSLVRAYCPSLEVSRNTAGAENNCASKGYNCESVSGLCHTSCTDGSACAEGYNCDRNQCVTGVPESHD